MSSLLHTFVIIRAAADVGVYELGEWAYVYPDEFLMSLQHQGSAERKRATKARIRSCWTYTCCYLCPPWHLTLTFSTTSAHLKCVRSVEGNLLNSGRVTLLFLPTRRFLDPRLEVLSIGSSFASGVICEANATRIRQRSTGTAGNAAATLRRTRRFGAMISTSQVAFALRGLPEQCRCRLWPTMLWNTPRVYGASSS